MEQIPGYSERDICGRYTHLHIQSYGAKHVFDYNDPKVIEKISEAVPDLQYIFDTIGNTTSSALSSRAFGDREGRLGTVRPGKANTEQVTANMHVTDVLVWTAFLKDPAMANSIGQPRKMTMS
ncbi:hypothetical protein N7465_008515 [Penicillium sp. CMV-2018d]|nr:hypothetical protein N7465_008515 [Penicillium sp. CMV-2018d]